jgi:hypothetical protein
MRRLVGAVVGGVSCALALAAPAWAHGADAPDATDYRTAVVAVDPPLPGVTVRAIEAGARLELTNRSAAPVEVLGYDGEPYLSVRPDGVYENAHSPAVYLNATLTGSAALPAEADPTLPPRWRRVSDSPVARWHDARSHWMSAQQPPAVAADPGREHRIRDWVVPLRVETSTVEVRGTLDWVPPPPPWSWWGVVVVAALGVGALGLASARWVGPALAGLLAVASGAALAYAVARELDAGAVGFGEVLRGLLVGQVWPVLVGLGALGAAGYALLRRPAADFALALAATCLAVFAGVTNAAVFTRSVAPVPWPPPLARVAVAVVLAAGAGVAAAAALRLRAAARTAAVAAGEAAT